MFGQDFGKNKCLWGVTKVVFLEADESSFFPKVLSEKHFWEKIHLEALLKCLVKHRIAAQKWFFLIYWANTNCFSQKVVFSKSTFEKYMLRCIFKLFGQILVAAQKCFQIY